jgi:type IV pilus assembly protein PilQ
MRGARRIKRGKASPAQAGVAHETDEFDLFTDSRLVGRDEMRLKQLLGPALAALVLSAAGYAESQLTEIRVQNQTDATLVAIRANGAFTHNEYRPADNLLIVDLSGVSAGKLVNEAKALSAAGVAGYKVSSYRSASGLQMARVELQLTPHAVVHLKDDMADHQVLVRLTGDTEPRAAAAEAAPVAMAPEPVLKPAAYVPAKAVPAKASAGTATAIVQGVSVVRGRGGMDIEIRASGPVLANAMKLREPDRVVIDIPNSRPLLRHPREIPVNSEEIKSVRIGWYVHDPSVTRIVIDLTSAHDYQLATVGHKLTVRLRPVTQVASAPAATTGERTAATESTPAETQTATAPIPAPIANRVVAKTPVEAQTQTEPAAIAKASAPAETPAPAPAQAAPAPAATPAATATAKPTASDLVITHPQYHEVAPAESTASNKAAGAAQKFGAAPAAEIPLTVPASASLRAPAMNMAAMQQQAQTAPQPVSMLVSSGPKPCITGKYTGDPISTNLKDVDLKDFFRLIHEISGLNVVLDPGVTGTLTLVLDDVPWDQALTIVLNNNGLECQLDGNVLRIALPSTLKKEAENRKAAQEAQAQAVDKITVTRYLSYANAKDVAPILKQFLSSRGDIIADDRTNSLIISDIPNVIPNLDRLRQELDRKTQEVEIEARVVAATRNFSQDLGSQLGFAYGNGKSTAVGGATAVGTSPIQVGQGTSGAGGSGGGTTTSPPFITVGQGQIPLFSNNPAADVLGGLSFINLGANYRLDTILTAAERRGLLKVLSRPRVTTQNNISAVIKQGQRIPTVTAAQLGGPPTTTYVDAFLRLTVKPQITAENTIFLNVDVENTTPDFGRQVGGNPTLVQQQATTQVLVADGGTVVIGGVIQTQDSVNIQQVPFIANIPIFGNLFKRRTVTTSTQELIFFITPKIVQT